MMKSANWRRALGNADEQSASMEEIAASSQSLAKLAMELQEAVSQFRV